MQFLTRYLLPISAIVALSVSCDNGFMGTGGGSASGKKPFTGGNGGPQNQPAGADQFGNPNNPFGPNGGINPNDPNNPNLNNPNNPNGGGPIGDLGGGGGGEQIVFGDAIVDTLRVDDDHSGIVDIELSALVNGQIKTTGKVRLSQVKASTTLEGVCTKGTPVAFTLKIWANNQPIPVNKSIGPGAAIGYYGGSSFLFGIESRMDEVSYWGNDDFVARVSCVDGESTEGGSGEFIIKVSNLCFDQRIPNNGMDLINRDAGRGKGDSFGRQCNGG